MTKKEYILFNWYPSLPLAWRSNREVRIELSANGNYVGFVNGRPHYISRNEVENKPLFWGRLQKHTFVDDIIDEPSMTINNSKQTPAIPYEKIQHRADFLNNFKNGWELYNTNPLFRTITMLMMSGASIYDLFLELIFMVDGRKMPEISIGDFLASNKEQDNETK